MYIYIYIYISIRIYQSQFVPILIFIYRPCLSHSVYIHLSVGQSICFTRIKQAKSNFENANVSASLY